MDSELRGSFRTEAATVVEVAKTVVRAGADFIVNCFAKEAAKLLV